MKRVQMLNKLLLIIAILVFIYGCTKEHNDVPTEFNYSYFTDLRDGKTYKTIKIGNQEWMAENLAYKTSAGSWCYYNSQEFGSKFGRLYTWEAALEAVPDGWHLPSDEEWKKLEMELGMSQTSADGTDFRGSNEGDKLKSTEGWSEKGNGSNLVGFTALPGGIYLNSGSFLVKDWIGYWWSSTENDEKTAWFRQLAYNSSKIFRNTSFKGDGYSVRCVKN